MFKKMFSTSSVSGTASSSGGSGGNTVVSPGRGGGGGGGGLYDDDDDQLGHPDAVVRLASAVHRFRVPTIGRTVSFQRAFKTVGTHPATTDGTRKADECRKKLQDALSAKTTSGERVYSEATRYLPFIHQLLITCKVQPDVARLDERLTFEWQSGLEKEPEKFTSEALMYDMVMCLASQALGKAASATEASLAGDFAAASREYAAAAGVMKFLAEDHLPKWIAKGSNVEDQKLPTEASIGSCEAFEELFLANGQQMAIATVLVKPGSPNYGLLAKLGLGVQERLEKFTSTLKKEAPDQMERLDPDVFNLCTFQSTVQDSLTNYFYARARWENQDYGIAIALLNDANAILKPGRGLPEITKASPLLPLQKELSDLRSHYAKLLKSWNDDNGKVYFEQVPPRVPENERVPQSLLLTKPTPCNLPENVDPLLLQLPTVSSISSNQSPPPPAYDSFFLRRKARPAPPKRSDSDLARELQQKLNAGME